MLDYWLEWKSSMWQLLSYKSDLHFSLISSSCLIYHTHIQFPDTLNKRFGNRSTNHTVLTVVIMAVPKKLFYWQSGGRGNCLLLQRAKRPGITLKQSSRGIGKIHNQTIRNAQGGRYDCQNLVNNNTPANYSLCFVPVIAFRGTILRYHWKRYNGAALHLIYWYMPGVNIRLVFSQYRGQETYV